MKRRRLTALLLIALALFAILEIAVGPAAERARHGAELDHVKIDSERAGDNPTAEVVVPDGGDPNGMLVFLHGRSDGSPDVEPSGAMYDALEAAGDDAPLVVFPNGAGDSYWHDRESGDWGSWIIEDVIPRLAGDYGLDPQRVAIGGISMGGFGAFDIARLHPGRFCAVGGHSPALWQSGGETAAGAFDSAADFARHDIVGTARSDPGAWAGTPLWIDGGRDDPFQPGIHAFTGALTAAGVPISAHFPPGEHEGEYWDAHWGSYMRFYTRALADC